MPPITRSVVRRRNWRWSPGNYRTPRGWVCFPGPGTAVADFDTFDDAEADRSKRESAVRLKMNPFDCGPLPMVSSLPDPILRDFLMDTGIEPPAAGIEWDAWWLANREQLSDEQRARVWQAADKVRFFEITEEAVGPEVHVVLDVTWEEREGIHVAVWDGGELIRAFRSEKRASELVRERSQQLRIGYAGRRGVDGPPFANCRPCDVPDPFNPGSTRLLRLPQVSFCESRIIPFDQSGDTLGIPSERVSVVVRYDYAAPTHGFRCESRERGVPVRAFADWEKASEYAAEWERAARAWFNPFSIALNPESLSRDATRTLEEFCEDRGITGCQENEWARWWAEHITTLPEDKRDPFWQLLDEVRFYAVVSVAFE